MKKYLNLRFAFVLCLVLSLTLVQSFAVYADVNDLMIGTGSNALMTLDLSDDEYAVMPLSSIGTVVNTISPGSGFWISGRATNGSSSYNSYSSYTVTDDGRFDFYLGEPLDGYYYTRIIFTVGKESLPPAGGYLVSLDFGSDFSYDYSWNDLWTQKNTDNASPVSNDISFDYVSESGDIYVAPFELYLTNINQASFIFGFKGTSVRNIGGSVAINFTPYDVSSSAPSTAGTNTSVTDYQSGVSDSLSDLSSSVDTMTDEISGVTEAIQNLQGAMEPHYSNVLTQLHHITEQLHAFYDQIYNNIHLKEYALWQDIKTAIENIDLEVNVNLDKLKTSIDNMSTAIQNKLQSVQEAITNGFDNQGINQDAAELDQSLQEYEEAEQTVLDQVNDSLNDFEFDSGFDEYKTTISVFSDFLQDLYDSSGGFKVVINLSLMLSIAGIVIGVYRFRNGG